MRILKYQEVAANINKKIYPLYIIIGQDDYLQNDITQQIKQAWKKLGSVDSEIIEIDDDWKNAFLSANSYSLFNDLSFLEIRYNKKSTTNNFKESLLGYVDNYNPKTMVIIKAPNLTFKQLDFIITNKNIQIFSAQQFNHHELEIWIKNELKRLNIISDPNIPQLISQYTQNNMQAAHHTLIKLSLVYKGGEKVTEDEILKFIDDNSEYPIYELTAACLQANSKLAISILRKYANNNQNTNVYILWIISHEIQNLIQLKQNQISKSEIQTVCKKLKIWPQKIKMYEKAISRFSLNQLEIILKHCAFLELKLKSSTIMNFWDKLEHLILLICLGWKKNDTILVNEI